MPYLISYARQRKLANPNDRMFLEIVEHLRRIDPRAPQNADLSRKMQTWGVWDLEEYDFPAEVMHAPSIKEQEKRLMTILEKLPKTHYPRTRPYVLSYMEFISSKRASMAALRKKGADLGQPFVRSEGVLQALTILYEKQPYWENAEAMVKKLQIDKRQQALVRLRAAARVGEWGLFMDVIKKDKLKFPALYYAQTCLEYNNKELAITYIRQMPKVDERVRLFMDLEYVPIS